jgi:hypothetical protein
MTTSRKARAGLTDFTDSPAEFADDEEARADARFAAWQRRTARSRDGSADGAELPDADGAAAGRAG